MRISDLKNKKISPFSSKLDFDILPHSAQIVSSQKFDFPLRKPPTYSWESTNFFIIETEW